ncbi:MAG: SDR family NAD(P)-dependent oxidoreductase [Gammaproteobacteria bacterium]
MRLDGKVALVSGGTRGIGAGIVMRLAEEGARVAFTGRDAEQGARVEAAVARAGGAACFIAADMGEESAVAGAVEAAVHRFGKLTTLVNNHTPSSMLQPGGGDGPVASVGEAAYRRIMRVGFDGVRWAIAQAIPHLRRAGGGAIVNISSAVSVRGSPGLFAYTAAKGAMNAVTAQVAVDCAEDNIRCNGIIVGPIVKEGPGQNPSAFDRQEVRAAFRRMVLRPRLGEPRDVANAVLFLVSDEADYVTGVLLPVDGGMLCWQGAPDITQGA